MKNVFVPVYNKFIDYKQRIDFDTGEIIKNEYALTPNELYVYFYLHAHRNYRTDTILTSVDLLCQQIQLYSYKDKILRMDKNKVEIKNSIVNLIHKKTIKCSKLEFNYFDILDIDFNKLTGGHEQVEYDIYEKSGKPKYFFILCCVLALKRPIAYTEFANRMGCSDKHIKKLIKEIGNDHDRNRILNIYHGKYFKDSDRNLKQEINKYTVNENIFIENRKHNWYDWKENLTYNDYVIYRTTDDNRLIGEAKKRIKALGNKGFNFENWKIKFEKELEKENDLIDDDRSSSDVLDITKKQKEKYEKKNDEDKDNEIVPIWEL